MVVAIIMQAKKAAEPEEKRRAQRDNMDTPMALNVDLQ